MKQDNPFQPSSLESKDISKTAKDSYQDLKEGVKDIATSTKEGAKDVVGSAKEGAKDIAASAKEGAKDIAASGKESSFGGTPLGGTSFGGTPLAGRDYERQDTGVKEVVKAAKSAGSHIKEGAKDVLEDASGGARDIGRSVSAAADDIEKTGKKVMQDAAEGAKGLAQVAGEAAEGAKEIVEGVKSETQSMYRHTKERVIDSAHRVGPSLRRANRATGAFVSSNAIPISLLGFGAGWFLISGRKKGRNGVSRQLGTQIESEPRRLSATSMGAADQESKRIATIAKTTSERPALGSSAVEETKEAVETFAHRVNERAHETAHVVRDRVVDVTHRAVHQAEVVRDAIGDKTAKLKSEASIQTERVKAATHRMAEGNPLLLVALSLGAGMGTAMLFPHTKREDTLMGDARDRLIGEARETATGVGQVAKKAAVDLRNTISP